jgi:hypothetical protein
MPQVRLYRFLNWNANKYGEPFSLCDGCKPGQPIPEFCHMETIADASRQPCVKCGKENVLAKLQSKLERELVGVELWLDADEWKCQKAAGGAFPDFVVEMMDRV